MDIPMDIHIHGNPVQTPLGELIALPSPHSWINFAAQDDSRFAARQKRESNQFLEKSIYGPA